MQFPNLLKKFGDKLFFGREATTHISIYQIGTFYNEARITKGWRIFRLLPISNGTGRKPPMTESNRQILWADVQKWLVKRGKKQYFFHLKGKEETWKQGTPPGIRKRDMEIIFNAN
jgi:hypothetical protein